LGTKISVIGQGYVGLPLSIHAAESGYLVTGIDLDERKIQEIKSGNSTIEDISSERLLNQINSGHYCISKDYSKIKDSTIVLICVPTPLDVNRKPDLSYVINAISEVSKYLSPGSLVILESTVEPGTTRNFLLPKLLQGTGFSPKQVDVAFSPERIDPTNKLWNLTSTPKVVSGVTEIAKQRAVDFYKKFVDVIVECESPEIAETAKLIENSFRLINISFVNEITKFCNKLGIDVNKVISAASTKPYGFMSFYPGLGVGGHCIPVDPVYLSQKAKALGASISLIDAAITINDSMPDFFISEAEKKLNTLENSKILVIGVAYKPNVSDSRETPVLALVSGLRKRKATVFWHDDLVKEWNGEKSVVLSSDYDLAILATPHDYLDLTKLGDVPILNTRGSI
jgi:UDP-N-acetyl-D-glucosamine dehydrogenase